GADGRRPLGDGACRAPGSGRPVTALAELEKNINDLSARPGGTELPGSAERVVHELLDALESGELRAATREADGSWRAVPSAQRGILLGFRIGKLQQMNAGALVFVDK